MSGKSILLIVVAGVCFTGGLLHFSPPPPVAPVPVVPGPHSLPHPVALSASAAWSLPPPAPVPDTFATLMLADPEDRDARAASVLVELCHTGQFQTAFNLVATAPQAMQAGFYRIVCYRWAQSRPQDTVQSLAGITNAEAHSAALRSTADGWNVNDPGGLAVYASALPASGDRSYALTEALSNWSMQDPAAMATWLNTVPPGNEFDAGAAMMIARTDSANRPPELAMQWVENINNPLLKQNAFQQVVTEWAQTDADAARKYVEQASWLDDTLRGKTMEALSTPP